MPAQSKQQQKFMGIVRAIQKGDQPASKFSKKAQDAADDMKKKDVEKYASTKHKGLPKKVEQALREKIRTMVEDYVESCGYVMSAEDPDYKLKSPGGTGKLDRKLKELAEKVGGCLCEKCWKGYKIHPKRKTKILFGKRYPNCVKKEDRELKENAGVPNKMRAGFKKLKNKEGLSIEERDELYKVYKGIVELMTYGNFYDNKKPNKRRKELSELTFDINYALVGSKRLGSYQGRFEKIFKKFLNMINTQIKREEKGLKTDYRKAMRASKLDDVKNIFKNVTKYARTQKGIQKGTNEGFGSNEFLTKTEKKKFEKERLENAEVLGYKLTGTKDLKESVNEDGHTDVPSAVRKLKTSIEDALQIIGYLKKVNDAEPLPSWWTDKVTLSSNYLNTARNYILNPHESVFAVRQDKIKNGERFPKEPNFDYDPEKGKSRIRKVNEAMKPSAIKKMRAEFERTGELPPHLKKFVKDVNILKKKHKVKNIVVPGLEWMSDMKEQSVNEARLNPKETIKQLGGNRFLYMVGAKNLAVDKPRNELHMKIMRNAKGVSHVVIKLTSLDLYDMKFLSIRAGKIRVKATEKGVYGDQLATFFKKHTGLNTRL